MADPKYDLRILIRDNLNESALYDDNDDGIRQITLYAQPPKFLISDYFILRRFDLLYTFGNVYVDPSRHVQNIPILYKGRFQIGIWVIDKTGLTAELLRWLALEEVRRILIANPSTQRIFSEEDDDRYISGYKVYNTNIIVAHDDYV